jgi:hypothetical protein
VIVISAMKVFHFEIIAIIPPQNQKPVFPGTLPKVKNHSVADVNSFGRVHENEYSVIDVPRFGLLHATKLSFPVRRGVFRKKYLASPRLQVLRIVLDEIIRYMIDKRPCMIAYPFGAQSGS